LLMFHCLHAHFQTNSYTKSSHLSSKSPICIKKFSQTTGLFQICSNMGNLHDVEIKW
jgi:hypothetical protein